MGTVKRVRRLVNGRSRGGKVRKANPGRRRLSDKQIAHFGTRRQKAALKARRSRKRGTGMAKSKAKTSTRSTRSTVSRRKVSAKSNPRRRRTVRKSSNPVPVLIALGAANPRKGKRGGSTMAKKSRRSSTRRRRATTKRRNPRVIYRSAPRRRRRVSAATGPVRRRRRNGRRRNPAAFGQKVTSGRFMQALLGGLVGVAATKFIPTLIPAGLVQGGNVVRFVISAASAVAAGMLAQKFAGASGFGDGVMFGGLMQAASVGMNAFLPPSAGFLALNGGRGMGDFVGSRFVVPQNPISGYVAPAAPAARVNMSGIQRSFGTAF